MKIALFYHSLASDWNHGNAHFLRGMVRELSRRGHDVVVYEPENGWSLSNLKKDHGAGKASEFTTYYSRMKPRFYDQDNPDYKAMLKDVDLVIVHEWNPHELIAALGKLKPAFGYKLLFHDTHHRAVSDTESMSRYDFSNYDGALVFGDVLKRIYLQKGWVNKVCTWHEAADTELFHPILETEKEGDLVWIGNWGDDERAAELEEFLIRPVKNLGIKAKVYGVRYPETALKALKEAGIEYGGYLPNYNAPEIFARYRVTVHIPRRPYVELLQGIPTIRPFEALACGIPLISAPWDDAEHLFVSGRDFLTADNGSQMQAAILRVLSDDSLARNLSQTGRNTILARHTCVHRADELEAVFAEIGLPQSAIHPKPKTLNT